MSRIYHNEAMRRGVLKLTKVEGELVKSILEKVAQPGVQEVIGRLTVALTTPVVGDSVNVSVNEEDIERLQDCLGIPMQNESAAATSLRKKLGTMFLDM